jgi:hypothetical protein
MKNIKQAKGVRKTILDNGLKVVTEQIDSVKSVAV